MQTVNCQRLLKGCMWMAIAVGAYSRLRGLGTWPWALDEYFIAQSVENIIQHGMPAFDCGGYYMRGLTLQYLIVPLYWLGIHAELAARLIPVAFSFLALAAVYFLGKRLSGVTVACISVGLLSVSLWEIEFARFARMYMPFQAIFLCYLVALHRVVVDRKSAAFGWLWVLSVAGVLTWAGGVFLLVTNFMPNLMKSAPGRARHVVLSLGLVLLGVFYSTVNFRYMGNQPALPPNVPIELGNAPFIVPHLLASTVLSYPAWAACALVALLISLAASVTVARAPGAMARERVAWAMLVALSVLNLFGCVLFGLALALLLQWIDARHASRRCAAAAASAIALNFAFWLSYAAHTDAWRQSFPGFGPGGELSKLGVVLFKYPNIFDSILFPWLRAVPLLTAVLGGLFGLACTWVILAKQGERLLSLRLTLAVCVLMAAMVGVTGTEYDTTRYTFFLLPVFYLIAVTVIYALLVRPIRSQPVRGTALGLAMLALVVGTEDFGWAHMVHIGRMDWNYRLHYDEARSAHYYPRWDYRTPGQYVNRQARPKDVVIITKLAVAPYLERLDYVYSNFRWTEFASISCAAGQRERWTGSRLLYRREDLFNAIDAASGDIWLITRLGWQFPPENDLRQSFAITLVYRSLDGKIGVYKVAQPR